MVKGLLELIEYPEEGPEIGCGRENAWRAPLYREVVKKVLVEVKPS